jgi:chorismate mutase
MATGVPEAKIPDMFVDHEIARSRKGKAGQIVVHSLGGIHKNAAARTAQRFEHDLTTGREDIIQKLEAAGPCPQNIERLRDFLVANPRWSFARAVAESKADLAGAIDVYARGALALNKLTVVTELYKAMPTLMRDIMRHAIDHEEDCGTCFGLGLVKQRADSDKLKLRCPACRGTGKRLVSSEHKVFALQKALELARILPEKGPMVAVQQNNQTVISGEGGLLEKMSKTADEILYNRYSPVIDVEVMKDGE